MEEGLGWREGKSRARHTAGALVVGGRPVEGRGREPRGNCSVRGHPGVERVNHIVGSVGCIWKPRLKYRDHLFM